MVDAVLSDTGAAKSAVRLSAKLIVGADGASSRVRNALGVSPQPPRRTGIAVRAYTSSVSVDPSRLCVSFDDGLRPGYGWLFPFADGTANIGVGMVVADRKTQSVSLHDLLRSYQQSLSRRGVTTDGLEQPKVHILPHGGKLPTMIGDRVALVGDAAAMINPLSGEGIAYAMSAARMLAESVSGPVLAGDDLGPGLKEYSGNVKAAFRRHMRSNYVAHRLLRSGTWSKFVLGAASDDPQLRSLAADLMFGNGHLTGSSFRRLLRSAKPGSSSRSSRPVR